MCKLFIPYLKRLKGFLRRRKNEIAMHLDLNLFTIAFICLYFVSVHFGNAMQPVALTGGGM